MEIVYRIIYNSWVNRILRNVNKALSPVLPKSFRIPPAGELTVQLKTQSFKFLTNQTNYTSHLIFWNGTYSIEYTIIFESLIKKCHCFFDIGSHAGYYSLLATTVNPNLKAYAFEPAPGPYYYLKKNVALNKLESQIKTFPVALGNYEGKAHFLEAIHSKYKYLKNNLIAVSNLNLHQSGRIMKDIEVELTTLDRFIVAHPGSFPDIIKMDTEGTENLILAGAQEVLKKRPIIICETLFNKIEGTLEDMMKKHGYLFFNYINGKLHEVQTLRRTIDNGVHDCFFVHPEKVHLIEEYVNKRVAGN